ncbi:MAG: glutamyl-tRNA reductase [Vampirovibrionales bacterium]|nr:glutamyl-tRNA reductase [Vampirovibrionales bacterium]
MHTFVFSLRYNRAPVAYREVFAFSDDALLANMPQWQAALGAESLAVVSTCNRTEVYVAITGTAERACALKPQIAELLCQARGLSAEAYVPSLLKATVCYLAEDAVRHGLRVAAGLDSMILAEDQILGQVKQALRLAQKAKTAGKTIDRLFKTAIVAGKRVRHETGIAQRDASLSHAAFAFAQQHVPALASGHASPTPIAILGAGKMAEILLQAIASQQPALLPLCRVVNRGEKRLQALTSRYGVSGFAWESLSQALDGVCAVFVASGAPHPVLYPEQLPERTTASEPCWVIDISVPRNVEASVGEVKNYALCNTDTLAAFLGRVAEDTLSVAAMAKQITLAEAIVYEEVERFNDWLSGLDGSKTLARFQARINGLHEHALSECTQSLDASLKQNVALASRQVLNQLLHAPYSHLRALTQQSNGSARQQYVQSLVTLRHLFALDRE